MKEQIISKCPMCRSKMLISEFRCSECGTAVSGDMEIPNVCLLPEDAYNFMLVFIKNRGNIREIEKELNISYPTVRSRLDNLLELMGFIPKSGKTEINEILDKLQSGEITAQEAEKMIRKIKE
jgi:hypothetical protein